MSKLLYDKLSSERIDKLKIQEGIPTVRELLERFSVTKLLAALVKHDVVPNNV